MGKIVAAVVGVTLVGMLFVGSFLGAFSSPAPHDVPIAVVGPAPLVRQLSTAMGQAKPGAFELSAYTSVDEARQALLDREVDAVFVPQEHRLIVASATGRAGTTAITTAFQAASQAATPHPTQGQPGQGQPGRGQLGQGVGAGLVVEDVAALPPADAGGISGMFYTMSLLIPAIMLSVLLAQVAPSLGFAGRVAALAGGSLVVGTAIGWLAHSAFEVLPHHFWPLAGVSAALVFTVGVVGAGMVKLVGPAGVGLVALLFMVIGLPASGGPMGARYIPEWYAAVGRYLPVGPGSEAIRNTVFFDGAALTWPLAVLGVWSLVGLTLLALPGRSRRETGERPKSLQPTPVTG